MSGRKGVERAVSSGHKDISRGVITRDSSAGHPDRASSIRIGHTGTAGSGDEHALLHESGVIVGKQPAVVRDLIAVRSVPDVDRMVEEQKPGPVQLV